MTATWITGDTRKVLAQLPDGCVDLVMCSPPFLALRSYLPAHHPDKALEIGSEPTPAEFVDALLDVTEELGRVLAPHGSLCVELGDTYAGHDNRGSHPDPGRHEAKVHSVTTGCGWPDAKSLCLIPESYRWALAYGRNPHNGRETPTWRVRNVIRWCRPNPPVGALCVDDQTEALTLDGWKRHDQLRDGDLIAAYDKATDSCRWLPAKFVRWNRVDESMVSIEKRKTSQRLTEDHRCLVRTRKRPDPHVVLAGDLTNVHQVMLAAPFDDIAEQAPVVSDEQAELLGYFVTEGTPKYRQALIRQSKTTNPHKVDRIRGLLDALGADYRESDYRRSSGPYGGHILTTFTVKGDLAAWLNGHHKRIPEHIATTWPVGTLKALYRGLVDGDGHRRRDGGVLFFQKDRQVVDAFQIIAIRLGLRCSVTRQERMDGWQATVGSPEHFESSRWTNVRKWDGEGVPRESYTGVVWCPMVETSFWLARRDGRTFITGNSDKFRPATSEMVVACKARDRWFDLDAVRTPLTDPGKVQRNGGARTHESRDPTGRETNDLVVQNPAGAPPLDYWVIPTESYTGAHYATFPRQLVVRPVKAMCPLEVCRDCGEPRRRIVGEPEYVTADGAKVEPHVWQSAIADRGAHSNKADGGITRHAETVGWTDCECGAPYRPGRVLDPFAGTGTTGVVAVGHGRDFIGIDLDSRNVALARDRIGPMFFSEATASELREMLSDAGPKTDRPTSPLLAQGQEGAS